MSYITEDRATTDDPRGGDTVDSLSLSELEQLCSLSPPGRDSKMEGGARDSSARKEIPQARKRYRWPGPPSDEATCPTRSSTETILVGGAVVLAASAGSKAVKLSQQDAQKIEEATGMPPEDEAALAE